MTIVRTMALLLAGAAAPLGAQMPAMAPAEHCAAPVPPPPELAAFATPAPTTAGDGVSGAATPALALGKAATLTLMPTKAVTFPILLSKPQTDGFGGIAEIVVPDKGTYRFALGAGAWIEVAGAAALEKSVAHSHGPACSGVRKIVDFALGPGRYTIELAGSREATVTLLAVKLS